MKKYIPIILAVIFFCASLSVKIELFDFVKQLSQEEYFCLQFALISPVTIIGGLILFIMPKMTLGWINIVFKVHRAYSSDEIMTVRLFGAAAVVLSIISLRYECFGL